MRTCRVWFRVLVLTGALAALAPSASAGPEIVQSLVVRFPRSGDVIVQAREEKDRFPRLLFVSRATGRVLHVQSIVDEEKSLKRTNMERGSLEPLLRFVAIKREGFPGPMILGVAVNPGGSDHAFYAVVVGEVGGRLRTLTPRPVFTHVQGGFALGRLGKQYGVGFVAWKFRWDDGAHYDLHRYDVEIYTLANDRFVRRAAGSTRRRYLEHDDSLLREFGIRLYDQRRLIPDVRTYAEYERPE